MLREMGHLQRHRPCGSHVAKNHDGTGYRSLAISYGGDRIFNGHFHAIAPDQDAVRGKAHGLVFADGHPNRIRCSFARIAIDDLEYIRSEEHTSELQSLR